MEDGDISKLRHEVADYKKKKEARDHGSHSRLGRLLGKLAGSADGLPSRSGRLSEYEATFGPVAGAEGIAGHLRKIKDSGRQPVVLDLMSAGAFVDDLGVQGLSVGLLTAKDKEQRYAGDVIDSDITDSRTWKSIRNWLDERGLPGFDLVVCRPIGAAEYVKGSSLNLALLDKMWGVTNPDGGKILSEFRSTDELKAGSQLLQEALSAKDVDVHVALRPKLINSVIGLDRRPENPESLVQAINL